jgi:tripartite-type tricarboxylate transporter receptor subunit TctC
MLTTKRHVLLSLIGAGAMVLMSGTAFADNCGLTRPIQAIVGYAPGGGSDSFARILAASISDSLDGTPMVIVNRAGGAQIPAMRYVKSSAPDGSTLNIVAMGGGLMATMLRDQGISWFDDFVPIAQFGVTNQALVVRAGDGIETATDLIEFIKARHAEGKKVRWSHPGRGSVSHVGVMAFLDMNGLLEMTQDVPFDGGAGTRNTLLSGDVDFSASGAHTIPAFAEELHAVGVLSEVRDPVVDSIPTLAEQGIEFVPVSSPIVLAAPKGIDPDMVTCLAAAVKQATQHDAFISMAHKSQQAVVYRDADETLEYLRMLAVAWEPTVAAVLAQQGN